MYTRFWHYSQQSNRNSKVLLLFLFLQSIISMKSITNIIKGGQNGKR